MTAQYGMQSQYGMQPQAGMYGQQPQYSGQMYGQMAAPAAQFPARPYGAGAMGGSMGGAAYGGAPPARRQRSGATDSKKLFVGSLPASVTDVELRTIFAPHGAMEPGDEVHILPPRGTRGMGCGFVKFVNPEDAGRAKDALHDKVLSFPSFFNYGGALLARLADNKSDGAAGAVMDAGSTKLFIGNLPANTGNQELGSLCSMFGELSEEDPVHVLPPKGTRGNLCGFVKFKIATDAANCIAALDQQPFPFPSFATTSEALLIRFADDNKR